MHEHLVTLAGTGMALPGVNGAPCLTRGAMMEAVFGATTRLSVWPPRSGLPETVAGVVHGLNPEVLLGLTPQQAARYSRATLLGAVALQGALADAGIDPANDHQPGRTLIVVGSLQYAASDLSTIYTKMHEGQAADLGLSYWLWGTPASVIGGISAILGLNWPHVSVAGSCSVGLRALQVGLWALRDGSADRLVVLGVDTCLDDVFMAGALHTSRSGYRAAAVGSDPHGVRPHDPHTSGNASGEGAIALIFGRSEVDQVGPKLRLSMVSTRSSGVSPVATGPTAPLSQATHELLGHSGTALQDVSFISDYADGTVFVDQHLASFLAELRDLQGWRGVLYLTNQEAVFGHVAGTGGLVRFLASVEMLRRRLIAPCANVETPTSLLPHVELAGGTLPDAPGPALIVSSGAGGDATTALVSLVEDEDDN